MNSRKIEQLLESHGFVFVRQKGSHRLFSNGDVSVIVPYRTQSLKKGTLADILKKANLR